MKIMITNDIYHVGVLNPNMRVFDVIMKTENGTSYNSYLVKGSKKTALIETVHKSYFKYYLENVKEIVELDSIDYLVMNHNEPDHSGAIAELVSLNPNITIVTSQAGAIYLKNITNNKDLKVQIAKDGEIIDLGDKTLKFISAPFLHWPDSMFTWVPEDQTLFSCDFLGCHYCEPYYLDTNITNIDDYNASLKTYYGGIFSPFRKYVVDGLSKIEDLDIEFLCTSHGPILTKGCQLEEVINKYKEWSKPVVRINKLIPVFYCSAYGNTEMLAKSIAEGIKSQLPDIDIPLYNVIECDMADLTAQLNISDAFLVGSPTINKDAVAPIWNLLSHVDAVNIAKKPVAVFGSFGWSGEAAGQIASRLELLKLSVFEEKFRVNFVPTKEDIDNAFQFGKSFADSLNLN